MVFLNSSTEHLTPKDDTYLVQRLEHYWHFSGIWPQHWSNILTTVVTQVRQYFAHKYDTIAFKNNWPTQAFRMVLFLALSRARSPWMWLNVVRVCLYEYIYIYFLFNSCRKTGSNHSIDNEVRSQLWIAACHGSDVVSRSSRWSLFRHNKTWWKLKCLQQWSSSQPKQFYSYIECWRLETFQYFILVEIRYRYHVFS